MRHLLVVCVSWVCHASPPSQSLPAHDNMYIKTNGELFAWCGVQLAAYTVVIEGLVIAAPSVTDKSMYGTLFVNARSPVIYQFLKPMEHI